ncbi:MAG: class I SAM-dependent methyltransferase [Desulfobacterota bacterium]|nr:class I SAM-dependent methyltransferase [Thermodesulfobacteriota bacterium]
MTPKPNSKVRVSIPHSQFFQRLAPHYDLLLDLFTFGGYRTFLRKGFGVLAPEKGEAILDLCSGTGRVAHWIVQAVGSKGRVIGMDITPRMVEVARGRSKGLRNLFFIEQDVTQPWPFQGPFDGIFISFGLHELPDRQRLGVLKRSFSSLKKGGRMVIADFNPEPCGLARTLLLLFFNLFERRNLNYFGFNLPMALKEAGFGRFQIASSAAGLLQITLARKD